MAKVLSDTDQHLKANPKELPELQELKKIEIDAFGSGLVDAIVSSEDDQTLPIMTIRFYILGFGLAVFGGILAQIYIFKPQPVNVSSLFLQVFGYCAGLFLAFLGKVATRGMDPNSSLAKFLYPGPFNIKEHAAITIFASTASGSALATELVATSDMYYSNPFTPFLGILLVYSSQLLGYGFAGLFRRMLVYPKAAFYPSSLAGVSLYETLHHSTGDVSKTWFPQWIAPFLTAISIFCLTNQTATPFTRLFGNENSINGGGYKMFTRVFGGSANNEGMGLFSLCLDWSLISNTCLTWPWATQVNMMVGVLVCIIMMPALYVGNVWNAQNFRFMGQSLYLENGTAYDQLQIINSDFSVNQTKLDNYGLPFYTATWAWSLLVNNLGLTACVTHILIYNWSVVKEGFLGIFTSRESSDSVKSPYPEVPQYVYMIVLALSTAAAFYIVIVNETDLPWWGLLVSLLLSACLVFVVGFITATTGFTLNVQGVVQLVGGFLHPGKPVANMYFTLYGYNSVNQAIALLADLKLGQYMHLPPRVVFSSQILGTLVGGACNFFMTQSIVNNNREVLLSPEGNEQWSGYMIQTFNSNAITWGAVPYDLFGPGKMYFLVMLALPLGFLLPLPFYGMHRLFPKAGFNYINVGIMCWFFAYLTVGVNSSIFSSILIGIFSQYYLRKYHGEFFGKYNYIISAGLDAGTQIAVFVINLAVLGALNTVTFPTWAMRRADPLYQDYCPQPNPF